jgi:putative tryptophan/tyrosine transport system substrate-binding protein
VNLLKDAVPAVARLALIFNPQVYVFEDYLVEIERGAAARAVNTIRTPVRNPSEINRAVEAFATEPNGALFLVPPPLTYSNAQLVLKLAVQRKLPTIFPDPSFAAAGGLMGYGPNTDEVIRGASSYVDRILRGTKVGDLPVQFPTKFDLVVNLKTAKQLGFAIPEPFLQSADEVIE